MATSISIRDLSKAVDDAVKLATQRHKVQFSPELLIAPGGIIGRQLSQANVSLHQAEQIAGEMAQHLETQALSSSASAPAKIEPLVLVRQGGIILGGRPVDQSIVVA
jgi:hypothetical protein